MMKTRARNNDSERGSVFFYILLGVVLFGALAFAVSRGMRSQSTDALTKRQTEIAVSEILSNAQNLARGIDKVRQRGVSEEDICFEHASISQVNNNAYTTLAGCGEDKGKLFHADGGGVTYLEIPKDWLDVLHANDQGYGEWMFTNKAAVSGLGQGDMGMESSSELVAHINHLKQSLCEAVNKELGIEGIPDNGAAFDASSPVSGPFSTGSRIEVPSLMAKKEGCFQTSNPWKSYVFYNVLIERD